ncbi:MAG: MogA/MoaB family molybdenum cofactor biosynthesis protein [Thermoplasmata archaeon]|jgi:molybdenum cofactor biosynthesis protein B
MEDHKLHSYKLNISVITVSSSRTKENDESGKIIIEYIKNSHHNLKFYDIVKDDIYEIRKKFFEYIEESDVLIFNGGTGISKYDLTPDAISPFLKILPGFGEIFRYLSYQEIGSSTIMSRALAGTYKDKIVFLLPGSPKACKLAMEKIIINELNHIHYELIK